MQHVCLWGGLDLEPGVQFLRVTCLVSKKVFAQIKVAVLRDSPEYRAGARGLLHLTSIIGVLREKRSTWVMIASPCSFLWWVHRQCRGRKSHQQDGLCALCCTQGHVHPGVIVPLWQPQSWPYFRCTNLYLASFAFDSLSFTLTLLCFFSLVWRLHGLLSELEGVSYSQSGWL